jgi:hypothetical protein
MAAAAAEFVSSPICSAKTRLESVFSEENRAGQSRDPGADNSHAAVSVHSRMM